VSVTEADPRDGLPAGGAPIYEVELRDVRIPTAEEGVTLAADLYLPVGAEAVPALVTVLPYRKDGPLGVAISPTMRWFAARGYATVLVDFRGTGSSDGAQRPPFDAAEADDGVAAVEWAATQPWSTGNVGMWGHSYGAIMSLRTAARRPSQLKAILPVMGALDLERDLVHPAGQQGCFTAVASWGLQTMLNQLLPPLEDSASAAQQRRWQRRLETEPWLLDLFRHKPGDAAWRSRAIDAGAIEVPTFCIAGWRDWFCDATIRAYEEISAPKKLLVGPWGHSLPDVTPIEPIAYQALALQWWEHWLADNDNGVMDEPEVLLFEQGATPRWRAFPSWPVTGDTYRSHGLDLVEAAAEASPADVLAQVVPDATVGAPGGSWGLGVGRTGLPLDQHDDDVRCICATSAPLTDDLVIGGRASVTVGLSAETTVPRVVARLADVDERGRSTAITFGIAARDGDECIVTFTPTHYRLAAGHRLRVSLGYADFPSIWAAPTDGTVPVLGITALELVLPLVDEDDGDAYAMPPSAGIDPALFALWVGQRDRCELARDAFNDSLTARVGTASTVYTRDRSQLLASEVDLTVAVTNADPGAMSVSGSAIGTVKAATGQTVVARAELYLTQHSISATATVDVDGIQVLSRSWPAS
jgi:uncharacterized protein